jgi:hypothetical protein
VQVKWWGAGQMVGRRSNGGAQDKLKAPKHLSTVSGSIEDKTNKQFLPRISSYYKTSKCKTR